jgi:probable rRNA maturation factor
MMKIKAGKKKAATDENTNRIMIENRSAVKPDFDTAALACFILNCEKKRDMDINIIFTNDDYLKKINLEYRKKNVTTDVISFETGSGGDILISTDTAKKQAAEYGVKLSEELARLVIHGVLHVIGYDHIKPQDAKKMRPKEKKYLKAREKL